MDFALHRLAGPLAALIVVIGVAAALTAMLGTRRRSSTAALDRPWRLEAKATLLSAPELALYRKLRQAAREHIVLSQVQLLQMVRFKHGAWDPSVRNSISQLSVDFLIIEPDTSIVAAVELDDGSHSRDKRRSADARKAHALASAGIPLLRWHVRQMPNVQAVEAALASLPARANTLAQAGRSAP
jgi:very-short-patch-repair endonuclease